MSPGGQVSRLPSAPASRAIASRAGGRPTCPGSQAQARLAELQQQIDAYRDLSSSLALDEAETAA